MNPRGLSIPRWVCLLLLATALHAQDVLVSPGSLYFTGLSGATISSQSVQVSSSDGLSHQWFTIVNTTGGNWLTVPPSPQPSTPQTVAFGINSAVTAGMSNGTYNATVLVGLSSGGNTQTINVQLCLGSSCVAPPTLSETSFTLTAPSNGIPQTANVTISAGNQTTWTSTTATGSGGSWLSVAPTGGTIPATITITADPVGLPPGTYNGTVTVTSGTGQAQVAIKFVVGADQGPGFILGSGATSTQFYAVAGVSPPSQQLYLRDDGRGPINWNAAITTQNGGNWLGLTTVNGTPVASGTTPADTYVAVNSAGLAARTYTGTITFNLPGSNIGPQSLTVTLTVAANSGKQLTAVTQIDNRTNILFIATQGVAAQAVNIAVRDSGNGGVNFVASPVTDTGGVWLTVTPTSGTTSASGTGLAVSVKTSLPPGTYSGRIVFTGAGIATPTQIAVTLTINPAPALTLDVSGLTFFATSGAPPPAAKTVVVGQSGNTNSDWTATISGGSWLTILPSSGTTVPSSSVNFSVNQAGLLSGTYNATVTFTAPGLLSKTLGVILNVSSQPLLTLNTANLSFSALQGTTAASQSIQLASSTGVLNWSSIVSVVTPPGGTWLSMSNNSGTTPANIDVNAAVAGLAPGNYLGTVLFQAGGAGNSQQLTVNLTVLPQVLLSANPEALSFTGMAGSPIAPRQFGVASSGASVAWSAGVSTKSGGNWLSVSPATGTTPGNVTVSTNPTGLAPGVYAGTVRVTAAGASNAVSVDITLTVLAPSLAVSTNSLSFATSVGGTLVPKTFTISSSGSSAMTWSAGVSTQSGGNWLSISPAAGTTPSTMTVSANPTGLAGGNYSGSILISASDGSPAQTVAVSLAISQVAVIGVGPAALQFQVSQASAAPQSASFDVQNLGSGSLGFSVTTATQAGGPWLSAIANSTTAPATVTVNVSPQGLLPGNYNGTVTVAAGQAANANNSPQTVNVSLSVDYPAIFAGGIVNGASFSTDPFASPGELMSLFGVNLAASTTAATSVPLPVSLGNTQVLVNGNAVPLFFVSPGQINFLFPEAVGNTATVSVVSGTQRSLAAQIGVAAATPGIFSAGGGQGLGMVLNQDFTQNSPTRPTSAGQVIQIFATGLGLANPKLPAGQAGASQTPFNNTVLTPVVTIGGINAQVVFSAVAPGLVGVYQVNAVVPANLPAGGFAVLQISAGGKTSNPVVLATK